MRIKLSYLLCFLILILMGCKDAQKEFYDSGNLKSEYYLADGEIDGFMTNYYESGEIESRIHYTNGAKNGLEERYYKSGKIKSKISWSKGVQDGKLLLYYENGELEYQANFLNNERVDTSFYFREGQVLDELKVYGRNGKVAYILKIGEEGDTTINSIIPILEYEPDTIQLGNTVDFIVDFTFYLEGKLGVELGYVENDNTLSSDTTFLLDKGETYVGFSYRPKYSGLNKIYLKMIYDSDLPSKEVGLDGVIKTVDIFASTDST